MISNKDRNIIVLLSIYLIALSCNLVMPLLSDDFTYQKLGLNLAVKFNHYLGWSGRVVADFISSAILQAPDRNLMSFINAIPVVAIIWLAALVYKKDVKSISAAALVSTFVAYIVFNPALGQTTFWIVGAANYLWTSMLCLGYILLFYRVFEGKKDNMVFAFILSLIAGCTNESSSATLVGFSALAVIYAWVKERHYFSRLVNMFIAFCIGAAVLILAPGNQARMTAPDFAAWREMSFFGHLKLHLFERLPDTSLPVSYSLVVIAILIIVSMLTKSNISRIDYFRYVVIPVLMSLAMAFIMFMSPYFPPRSLNMSLIVNLIPIGFLLTRIDVKVRVVIAIASVVFLAYLIPDIYINLSKGLI